LNAPAIVGLALPWTQVWSAGKVSDHLAISSVVTHRSEFP
jgi:hypothetical protein